MDMKKSIILAVVFLAMMLSFAFPVGTATALTTDVKTTSLQTADTNDLPNTEATNRLPDLVISSIHLGNTNIVVGELVKVSVITANTGSASSSPSITLLAYPNGSNSMAWNVGTIAPGSSVTSTADLRLCQSAGTYTFKVVADLLNGVKESNEGNNERLIAITCVEPTPAQSLVCPDIDRSGKIDLADFATYGGLVGKCKGDPGYLPGADFDSNGCIEGTGSLDYLCFKSVYGQNFTCGITPFYCTCSEGNADLDGNGVVNIGDLSIYASSVGKCEGDPGFVQDADFNGDGCVGGSGSADLLCFSREFNRRPTISSANTDHMTEAIISEVAKEDIQTASDLNEKAAILATEASVLSYSAGEIAKTETVSAQTAQAVSTVKQITSNTMQAVSSPVVSGSSYGSTGVPVPAIAIVPKCDQTLYVGQWHKEGDYAFQLVDIGKRITPVPTITSSPQVTTGTKISVPSSDTGIAQGSSGTAGYGVPTASESGGSGGGVSERPAPSMEEVPEKPVSPNAPTSVYDDYPDSDYAVRPRADSYYAVFAIYYQGKLVEKMQVNLWGAGSSTRTVGPDGSLITVMACKYSYIDETSSKPEWAEVGIEIGKPAVQVLCPAECKQENDMCICPTDKIQVGCACICDSNSPDCKCPCVSSGTSGGSVAPSVSDVDGMVQSATDKAAYAQTLLVKADQLTEKTNVITGSLTYAAPEVRQQLYEKIQYGTEADKAEVKKILASYADDALKESTGERSTIVNKGETKMAPARVSGDGESASVNLVTYKRLRTSEIRESLKLGKSASEIMQAMETGGMDVVRGAISIGSQSYAVTGAETGAGQVNPDTGGSPLAQAGSEIQKTIGQIGGGSKAYGTEAAGSGSTAATANSAGAASAKSVSISRTEQGVSVNIIINGKPVSLIVPS